MAWRCRQGLRALAHEGLWGCGCLLLLLPLQRASPAQLTLPWRWHPPGGRPSSAGDKQKGAAQVKHWHRPAGVEGACKSTVRHLGHTPTVCIAGIHTQVKGIPFVTKLVSLQAHSINEPVSKQTHTSPPPARPAIHRALICCHVNIQPEPALTCDKSGKLNSAVAARPVTPGMLAPPGVMFSMEGAPISGAKRP